MGNKSDELLKLETKISNQEKGLKELKETLKSSETSSQISKLETKITNQEKEIKELAKTSGFQNDNLSQEKFMKDQLTELKKQFENKFSGQEKDLKDLKESFVSSNTSTQISK